MGFYQELSEYYDTIFPMSNDKLSFINKFTKDRSDILDMACGTGAYSIELAKLGHNVDGIDLDEEMIKKGIENALKEDIDINLKVGDMTQIDRVFNKEYDLIFCIGNSLVHLDSKDEIKKLIGKVYNMLEDGGKCLIQIINYDRILKDDVKSLPTIDRENEGVKFVRKYQLAENKKGIYFNTEIIINNKEKNVSYNNSILLIPLLKDELVNMFKDSGFSEVNTFGNFKGDEYTFNSYPTIIVAKK